MILTGGLAVDSSTNDNGFLARLRTYPPYHSWPVVGDDDAADKLRLMRDHGEKHMNLAGHGQEAFVGTGCGQGYDHLDRGRAHIGQCNKDQWINHWTRWLSGPGHIDTLWLISCDVVRKSPVRCSNGSLVDGNDFVYKLARDLNCTVIAADCLVCVDSNGDVHLCEPGGGGSWLTFQPSSFAPVSNVKGSEDKIEYLIIEPATSGDLLLNSPQGRGGFMAISRSEIRKAQLNMGSTALIGIPQDATFLLEHIQFEAPLVSQCDCAIGAMVTGVLELQLEGSEPSRSMIILNHRIVLDSLDTKVIYRISAEGESLLADLAAGQ